MHFVIFIVLSKNDYFTTLFDNKVYIFIILRVVSL